MRGLGFSSGSRLVEDISTLDSTIRNRLETDSIVYIGHSMGLPIAVKSAITHNRPVKGFVGLASYPCGLSFTDRIGPLAYPLSHASPTAPVHNIIAKNDEILLTIIPMVRQFFLNRFSALPNGSCEVIPGNHCFNGRPYDFAPFNKDAPSALVEAVKQYLEKRGWA